MRWFLTLPAISGSHHTAHSTIANIGGFNGHINAHLNTEFFVKKTFSSLLRTESSLPKSYFAILKLFQVYSICRFWTHLNDISPQYYGLIAYKWVTVFGRVQGGLVLQWTLCNKDHKPKCCCNFGVPNFDIDDTFPQRSSLRSVGWRFYGKA